MNQRKRKIIDKKFQLQTTFSVIGIFFFITCLFILTIGINVFNDNKRVEHIIEEQESILASQEEIEKIILGNLILKDDSDAVLDSEIREKCNKNIISMKNNMELLKKLTRRNNHIFLIVIIFIISAGFILYPVLIRKTHQISGPIYIMSEYIKEIINGRHPEIRPLRKKDELKSFYDLFSQLVHFIKKQDTKKEKK
ncbi:MAG: hypothetical protein JW864_08590 [Spirochaetes bacterium]|nr:hypothetical protein [Spirochaetota bacterium]